MQKINLANYFVLVHMPPIEEIGLRTTSWNKHLNELLEADFAFEDLLDMV